MQTLGAPPSSGITPSDAVRAPLLTVSPQRGSMTRYGRGTASLQIFNTTHEVDGRASAVARHQIAAMVGVFFRRHHLARRAQSLPANAEEHRLQDRDDFMGNQDVEQPVEILEIGRIELVEAAIWQVLEAFIGGAIARPASLHVGLHGHQARGTEAFRLPVGGVDAALFHGCPPGQRPGRVAC